MVSQGVKRAILTSNNVFNLRSNNVFNLRSKSGVKSGSFLGCFFGCIFSLFFGVNFEVSFGGQISGLGARDCTQHGLRIYFFLAEKIRHGGKIRLFADFGEFSKFAAVYSPRRHHHHIDESETIIL